ncbi:hypothetical protein Dpep_1390 [Dethiosulfovibrio peptidovorans DSM 11002]|uniref:Uncharacterized protein n=1 Tax=Dethiosulfovibrio peptidovorans DSM 11002 TaxID=469381 RepID=D2Z7G9_9BACT|nr:hypothetical protein Dpep_1390 [Dethiosulfovibrio peptidovorans DSM 11002]
MKATATLNLFVIIIVVVISCGVLPGVTVGV